MFRKLKLIWQKLGLNMVKKTAKQIMAEYNPEKVFDTLVEDLKDFDPNQAPPLDMPMFESSVVPKKLPQSFLPEYETVWHWYDAMAKQLTEDLKKPSPLFEAMKNQGKPKEIGQNLNDPEAGKVKFKIKTTPHTYPDPQDWEAKSEKAPDEGKCLSYNGTPVVISNNVPKGGYYVTYNPSAKPVAVAAKNKKYLSGLDQTYLNTYLNGYLKVKVQKLFPTKEQPFPGGEGQDAPHLRLKEDSNG